MAENIQRSRGRGQGYKFDRGGNPTEFGPFIGEVMNNIDTVRSGRLQVYIEQFAGDDKTDESLWRTVSYVPPFYGSVVQTGTDTGAGTFVGNPQSYGMWFTPPDLGTLVICFFVAGDPNQGYYMGCVPDTGLNHMIPGIGASKNFDLQNSDQKTYFADSTQLPVTEINDDNDTVSENPKFFDQNKPVHSVVAGIMLQQGIINDVDRGPITSNAQRESPSNAYGIATPGRPVYAGGLTDEDIKSQVDSGNLKPTDVKIVARRGGHSLVMDDGDLTGQDNLVRIRTSKGHQITMSDSGDFFYIIHANGQTWIELGAEGTVDVYATNSVNVRTEGTLNLHADQDINMYAGGNFNIKGKKVNINSSDVLNIAAVGKLTAYSQSDLGFLADGSLGFKGQSTNVQSEGDLSFKAGRINLNSGGGSVSISKPTVIADSQLPGVSFVQGTGWQVQDGAITTIVTRAPTHEPYPNHNKGISTKVDLAQPANETSGDGSSTVDSIPGTPAGVLPTANPVTPSAPAMDQLNTVPVTQPVTPANVLTQAPAITNVGALNTTQVTGLMSSTSLMVGQASGVISNAKGVGQFGLSITQLEQAGYVKPGTNAQFGSISGGLSAVLNNPSVWTGKSNTLNLNAFLSNTPLQSQVQQGLMTTGLNQLRVSGVITGKESTLQLAGLVSSAAKFGPASVGQWAQGIAGPTLTAQINAFTKNAQFSVNLVQNAFGGLSIGGFGSVGGGSGSVATNTVNRTAVNAALAAVIGNQKVPVPNYNNPVAAASTGSTSTASESGNTSTAGGTTTTVDIRSIQENAKADAYAQAIAQGKSPQEAENIASAAGNLAGANALANLNPAPNVNPGYS